MVIYDNFITGHPTTILGNLKRSLGAYSRHGDFHQKVGLTNNPDRRWSQAYEWAGWKRMNVVYSTTFYDHSQTVERELIKWIKQSRSGGYYHNEAPGGEGRPPFTGPYYVYIVGAPRFCRFYD
jgi:hypothetical protein